MENVNNFILGCSWPSWLQAESCSQPFVDYGSNFTSIFEVFKVLFGSVSCVHHPVVASLGPAWWSFPGLRSQSLLRFRGKHACIETKPRTSWTASCSCFPELLPFHGLISTFLLLRASSLFGSSARKAGAFVVHLSLHPCLGLSGWKIEERSSGIQPIAWEP